MSVLGRLSWRPILISNRDTTYFCITDSAKLILTVRVNTYSEFAVCSSGNDTFFVYSRIKEYGFARGQCRRRLMENQRPEEAIKLAAFGRR